MYVYDRALMALRKQRSVLRRIEKHDRDLARQLRRASSSVALNIAEGERATGGNSRVRLESAMNSARECRACFDVAEAMGYLDASACTELHQLYDGIAATLFVMTRR